VTSGDAVEGQLLGRAARIGRVLAKYGVRDLSSRDERDATRLRARNLRAAFEELGPTFAKLGQILSTRPDLLPAEYVDELSHLQDKVAPLTEAEVVSVMETELGVPWEDVFDSIDPEPLAAGTIGQVHRATLADGERVVVKVQRPTARSEIMRDLGLLELFVSKTEDKPAFRRVIDLPAVVEHLAASLRRELDFRFEDGNIARMRKVLAPYDRLDAPSVYDRFSTARLLVMEEIQGVSIRHAPESDARKQAARQLLEAYYAQILDEGFFHADPHPGNLMWADDKIYFLDFGMVGEVGPEERSLMLLLLMSFWQEDIPFLSEVILLLAGEHVPENLDMRAFEAELGALMAPFRHASLKEIQLGPVLQGITEIASRHDVRLPASLALTGKALAQMQLATAALDPELDPFSVVGGFLFRVFGERFKSGLDPKRMFYEAQKLRVRGVRLVEAFERMTGARPGPRFQVDLRGITSLEDTIRRAARQMSLAVTGGAALVATGFTASTSEVGTWVPATLGSVGGALIALMFLDLIRRRGRS
jgi:ubiquinone biosynthesis protein